MRANLWGSHTPLLYYSVIATEGDVLEIGAGVFSTHLLHFLLHGTEPQRNIVTVETNEDWFWNLSTYRGDWHEFACTKDLLDFCARFENQRFGVVFIDSKGEDLKKNPEDYDERLELCLKLRNSCTIMIVHDSNVLADRQEWKDLVAGYKYHVTDMTTTPWTTALSDTIDVKQFVEKHWITRKDQKCLALT